MDQLSTLPLWPVTNVEEHRSFLCDPHSEEHQLEVGWVTNASRFNTKPFASEGTAVPVPTVPLGKSEDLAIDGTESFRKVSTVATMSMRYGVTKLWVSSPTFV